MSLQVQDQAPDFQLMSNEGEEITLSKAIAKGPVVLAFFPLAFTGVCQEELCEFRDQLANFNQVKAQVFGISVDSRFALDAFAKANQLNFPLLSDFNKKAADAFGVLQQDFIGMHGVSKRSVFIIDSEQKIRYAWVTDDAKVKPDLDEVQKALNA